MLGAADVGIAPLEKNDRNTVQGAPINKLAHYLAAGRPVIAANLPVVREISNDSCTLYYEPGDENDLAEKIVALARDPARRVAMGEKAHLFAKEKVHADHGRTRLLKLYSGMLGGQAGEQPAAPREESSYAPTSVGEKALVDDAPHNRDAATLTFDSSTKRDPVSDPFRKLIAQTAAQLSGPIPDSLAPADSSEDGPATPRGLAVAAADGEAEPTSTAEPEAPAASPGKPEGAAEELPIDDVDPLEYDFNSPEPASPGGSRGVTAPAIQLPIMGDGFGLPEPTPIPAPAPAATTQPTLDWSEPAQLEFKLGEPEAEPASAPAAGSDEAEVAVSDDGQEEAEEQPLFKAESETVRWGEAPPSEEPGLPVEVDEPTADRTAPAVAGDFEGPPAPSEEPLTITPAEETPPASPVEEAPEPDLVVVEAKPDLPAVAAKPEPDEVAEAAFEVIQDSPTESPIAAEAVVEHLEPEEETTVMPEPLPAGPTAVSPEEIEVVEAETDLPVAGERPKAAATPFADVPWDVEPQGEAERRAAIEQAAANMPAPEPMEAVEPPAASMTEEVMVGDQDLEVVEVAPEAAREPAAEASPEEVFDVEEVIPEAASPVAPEPPAKPVPSNIVADFLQIEKPGAATARSSQNAVTLRMPSFRTAALVGATVSPSAPSAPAQAPTPAPAPAATPAALKPSASTAAAKPAVVPTPAAASAPAARPPAPAPAVASPGAASTQAPKPVGPQSAPLGRQPTGPPGATVAAQPAKPAAPVIAAPKAVTPVPVSKAVSAAASAPSVSAPVARPAQAGPGSTPTVNRPALRTPPSGQPAAPAATRPNPQVSAQQAKPAAAPAAVPPATAAPVAAAPTARPGMPLPWEAKPVAAPQPARPSAAPAASTPSSPTAPLPVAVRPAPGQVPGGAKPAVAAPPVLSPARQSGARPAASPVGSSSRPAAAGRAAPPVLYRAEPKAGRPGSKPSQPVELDAAEVVVVPTTTGVQTPPSGLPPSDEWLGHVLLGYAPFNVAISPRTVSGEIPLIDPSKASANPKR
ncbi:MAG: glycosyltransferase [Myxococcales bacterium]